MTRHSKLAGLTVCALPLLVIATLLSSNWHDAGFTNALLADPAVNESIESRRSPVSVAGGQTITSFIISPAAVPGGRPSTGTISLRYPASAGGILIALQNSGGSDVTIPSQVVIPEGKSGASFSITTKTVKTLVALSLSATYQTAIATNSLTILPAPKGQWFASPGGSPTGQGTQNSPWDLATALAHGPNREIRPGDTVWLRGGRYAGSYLSTLSGTEKEPIMVRGFPGERVIIDKATINDEKQPALKVKGSWVWFWGIEITNSNSNRQRNSPYTGRDQPWRGSGADVYAPNVKFINMIFHDNGQGIWDKQDMTEVHGCLFFYNGNNKREHGLYIGNAVGTKYITDNVLFDQGGYGILAHSDSSSSSQRGLHIEGNVSFNNGILTGDDQTTGNLQVGGVRGVAAERVVIKNNYIYNPAGNAASKNNGIRLGYDDTNNKDVKLHDNYIVSRVPLLIWWWQKVDFQGNTIYSAGESLNVKFPAGINRSNYRWDFNTYLSPEPAFANDSAMSGFARWRQQTGFDNHSQALATRRPAGVQIFIRPNKYEAGRAHIIVYNWDLRDQVAVDLSSILSPGANFEIRDAQNYFGDALVQTTYRGGPVFLPMKLSRMTLPVGNVERVPRHTAPEFAVFVLQPSH
ncbi:MAG: right-handed parallel beta-helix repeat-containing protein [Acidobacteriota bacterium]